MGISTLKPRLATLDTRTAKAVPQTKRIRGSRLQVIRRRIFLRDKYLCQKCLENGKHTVAVEVDHKIPLDFGGEESDENRWSLCEKCHREKTDEENKQRRIMQGAG